MILPTCVKCEVSMKVKRNGIELLEMAGAQNPQPYKLWQADLFMCPGCGIEIVSGYGQKPIAEHFQDGFKDRIKFHRIKNYERVQTRPNPVNFPDRRIGQERRQTLNPLHRRAFATRRTGTDRRAQTGTVLGITRDKYPVLGSQPGEGPF